MCSINEEILKFWVKDWEIQTSAHGQDLDFDYFNPRIVLIEIISEVENNQFRNQANNKIFRDSIEACLYDSAISKYLRPEFLFLKDNLLSTGNSQIVSLAKTLLEKLTTLDYRNLLVNELLLLISNTAYEPKNESKIRIINKHLIIELLFFGYGIKVIHNIPSNIFADAQELGGRVYTNFPLNLWKKELPISAAPETPEYGPEIRKTLENLKTVDRIQTIYRYFLKEQTESVFIVPIKGIKGKFSDFNIGPVNFYSPKKKYVKILCPGQNHEPELFYKEGENGDYLNAAVSIRYIDPIIGAQQAKEKIQLAFDLLRIRLDSDTPFEIQSKGSMFVDKDGRIINRSWSVEDTEFHHFMRSLDTDRVQVCEVLEEESLKLFNEILTGCAPRDFQAILSPALHWVRKAQEANNDLDKILFYWISVEKFSRFPSSYSGLDNNNDRIEKIKDIVAKLYAKNCFYCVGWSLFQKLKGIFFPYFGPQKSISDDLAQFLFIKPGVKKVVLSDFLRHLWEREGELSAVEILQDLEYCRNFYKKASDALSIIEKAERKARDSFALFYRARNQIVHDGEVSRHLIPYYLAKAREISYLLLSYIHKGFCKTKTYSFEEIFLNEISNYEFLKKGLKEGIPLERKLFESS